ncbi:MAG TPA: cell wall hydrolase [Novosphingobium sp.]|nr:cell wall hydrolase [Novosphingobium sp.]
MTSAPAIMARIGDREARPRDFATRFERQASSLGKRHGRMRRRRSAGFAALAAIAVPAVAAPDGWQHFVIADAVAEQPAVEPMPFERADTSFPGSAFYYLDLDSPAPQVGAGIHSDARDPATSPAARALRIDNSGVDRTRALQCLAAAVYYEAGSEPDAGQRAVAQVVLNRVAHPAYPNTVCGVVYQGSERSTGCQFTFTCDGSLARRPSPLFWERAMNVARAALSGYVYAPAGLATHYHTVQVTPYWASSLDYIGTIGAHRFYSFRGAAGRPATFRFAYTGGEPIAAPHRHGDSALAAGPDPVAVQRDFDALNPASTKAAPMPAAAQAPLIPLYTSEIRERGGDTIYRARNLPETQGIKAEYANSGRWIGLPTH